MAKARKSKSRGLTPRTERPPKPAGAGRLVDDVRRLIDEARQQLAQRVETEEHVKGLPSGKTPAKKKTAAKRQPRKES